MQINYLDVVSSVLNLMKQSESVSAQVKPCRICYTLLFKYLLNKGVPFTMDAAMDWLEDKSKSISKGTRDRYRTALYRLEHYMLFGNIDMPCNCATDEFFHCRSGMSESFFRLVYELRNYFTVSQNPYYFSKYSVAIKNFFKHATSLGVEEPEAITIDVIISFWNNYCLYPISASCRKNASCAITALMKYLYTRGDVPYCYQYLLPYNGIERMKGLKLSFVGTAFHPSMGLEIKMAEYLEVLTEWKYRDSSKELYRTDFNRYFLFLELNHIEHSSESVLLWENVLTAHLTREEEISPTIERRKHTIMMFNDYLNNCLDSNIRRKRAIGMDKLPEWSNGILNDFVKSRERDGMVRSTINMCRSAGYRFFKYLHEHNINSTESITPDIVKAFQAQDFHTTGESKNAYNVKLRQLLNYMAEHDLVSPTLSFAISAGYAPHRNIVDVLSNEMVEKIYEYRKEAFTPLELRDTAIVMLGLRMGIRGSDILNLKLNDFDWMKQTVSFVQKKNRTAITLPVPTDVGNSVYKYIIYGRPESADDGNGYIFIRHLAPYTSLKATTACRASLKRILSKYGFKMLPGQGFHMTRKTFATRMLRAENRLDDISNALGHVRQETSEVYLERDEEKMRLCPINFGGVFA